MSRLPDPSLRWPICMAAVALIAESEGCRLRAYKCPAGVPTIGWGETAGVKMGDVWTQEQADARLCADLTARVPQVQALLTEHAEPNQLGALVSLAYNIGLVAFAKSSVLKAHNRGDRAAAARAFGLWNKARVGGVLTELPGLTTRRAAEAALYLNPEPDAPREAMPQAVEAQPNLAGSPTMQTGTAAAGVGAVGVLAQFSDTLSPIKAAAAGAREFWVDTLGLPAEIFLPALLVLVGGIVLWRRFGQRQQGVA